MKKILLSIVLIASVLGLIAGPSWKRVNYPQSTIFTGVVTVDSKPAVAGDMIGIFVGEECRFIATIYQKNGVSYVSAVVHGEKSESATIRYWNATESKEYVVKDTLKTLPEGEILQYPINLKLDNGTGIAEKIAVPSLKVFPSPAKSTITIECTETISSLLIIDEKSNTVKKANNKKQQTFDISSLAQGIYFVQAKFANGTIQTAKIVKE